MFKQPFLPGFPDGAKKIGSLLSILGVYAQTLGIYNNEQNQYDMRDSLGTFLFQSFQNPLNRSAASWV